MKIVLLIFGPHFNEYSNWIGFQEQACWKRSFYYKSGFHLTPYTYSLFYKIRDDRRLKFRGKPSFYEIIWKENDIILILYYKIFYSLYIVSFNDIS